MTINSYITDLWLEHSFIDKKLFVRSFSNEFHISIIEIAYVYRLLYREPKVSLVYFISLKLSNFDFKDEPPIENDGRYKIHKKTLILSKFDF